MTTKVHTKRKMTSLNKRGQCNLQWNFPEGTRDIEDTLSDIDYSQENHIRHAKTQTKPKKNCKEYVEK